MSIEQTTDTETLEAIRAEIAKLPEEQQERIARYASTWRGVIAAFPECGLAMALVGAELATLEDA